jgi:hypothetical protein
MGPGECSRTTKDNPLRLTPSFSPLSILIAIAALQSPSVGCADKFEVIHGQRKAQLQVSTYCPSIFHPIFYPLLKIKQKSSSSSPR